MHLASIIGIGQKNRVAQGIQGNSGNFQVEENIRETQGNSGNFVLFFKLRETQGSYDFF